MAHHDGQHPSLFDEAPDAASTSATGDGDAADVKPVRSSRPEQVSNSGDTAEARPGYQHVQRVGWIPEAWEVVAVGELCNTYSGGTPSRGEPRYFGGSIAWIKSGELNQNEVLNTEERITQAGFENSSAKYIDPGTVLVALYGATAGVVSVSRIRATINQAVLAAFPDERMSNEFLRLALIHVMPRALHTMKQGGQPNLSGRLVQSIKLPRPPLPEQRRIASILATWDRALAQLGALVAAKERRLRGLMQRLLTGEVRFPEFEGEPWREVKLGEVAEVNPRANHDLGSDAPVSFIGMADVSEKGQIMNQSIKGLEEVDRGYTAFCEGDVLVAKITPCFENGKGFLAEGLENGVGYGSTEFHVLRAKERLEAKYLFYLTMSHPFRGRGEACMAGSAGHQRVRTNFVESYTFELPSLAEQRKIAATLSAAEAEVEALRRQRKALRRQKKGVMQRLLTGAVRVPAAQEAASAKDLSGLEDLNRSGRSGGRSAGGEEA